MFTGIIKDTGVVKKLRRSGGAYRLEAGSELLSESARIGDSISVNGVCLTVVGNSRRTLSFDIVPETVSKTALAGLKEGMRVNLEDAIRAGEPMGGHFVQGHVDCVGKIKDIAGSSGGYGITIGFPEEFSALVVEKGSMAVDGISLTVGEASGNSFRVYVIPHTLKMTTLSSMARGGIVNLEFDIIGKYVNRISSGRRGSRITEEFLKSKWY